MRTHSEEKSKKQSAKGSEELKNEVKGQVKQVKKDVGEIESSFSPGSMVDYNIFRGEEIQVKEAYSLLRHNMLGTLSLVLGSTVLHSSYKEGTYKNHSHGSYREELKAQRQKAKKIGADISHIKENISKIQQESQDELNQVAAAIGFGIGANIFTQAEEEQSEMNSRIQEDLAETVMQNLKETVMSKVQPKDTGTRPPN